MSECGEARYCLLWGEPAFPFLLSDAVRLPQRGLADHPWHFPSGPALCFPHWQVGGPHGTQVLTPAERRSRWPFQESLAFLCSCSPFIHSRVPTNTPRLLINKEKTGENDPLMSLMGFGCGMDFDSEKAYRDVAWLGDCDEGCLALAELLGWKKELEKLVREEQAAIDANSGQAPGDGASACSAPAKEAEQTPSPKKKCEEK